LAQFNRGTLAITPDDPRMLEFYAASAAVHDQHDSLPVFVWREQHFGFMPDNPFAHDELATMSVWRSLEALKDFTYSGAHLETLRRRATWFVREPHPNVVLWWVEVGHTPSPAEAVERLELLRASGPGPSAFTFAAPFPPPD
jgi:heme-degrading monooxygenase HmoA